MSLQPLNKVLNSLNTQYSRREHQQFQQLVKCWVEVVGPVVAVQTRPLSVYRGILKVATSSSAWAQNLVFERQRILEKLNQAGSFQIVDIRFSTAQWHASPAIASFPGEEQQTALWRSHPSRLSEVMDQEPTNYLPTEPTADLMTAFHNWAALMQLRSRQMPLCPKCHCPSPIGELQRWDCCAVCAAQQW